MSVTRPAPYPADTRAKGWRFELDYERIVQSSTWALAGPEARPWLLMMWLTSWQQLPCGSLPNDEAVIAAMIGAPAKVWAKHRAVLMRGWTVADDGLLYHPTICARVLEMLDYRKKNAERVAKFKAAKREERAGNALPTQQQPVRNGTGTGTGTGRDIPVEHHDAGGGAEDAWIVGNAKPTEAGALCRTLRQAGIADVNPGHPRLLALLDAGAQPVEFSGFVSQALDKAPGNPFAYLLGVVEGERTRAASASGRIHRGHLPNKQEAIEQRNAAAGDAWLAQQGAA